MGEGRKEEDGRTKGGRESDKYWKELMKRKERRKKEKAKPKKRQKEGKKRKKN